MKTAKRKASGKSGKKKGGGTRAKAPKKATAAVQRQAKDLGGAVGKAVANFAKSLGEMKIDDDAAADQMHEIGDALEDVAKAKMIADDKAETAKTAKATYESKVNLFMEKVRGFTHPKSLPLFDAPAAEKDRQQMLDAADKGGDVEKTGTDA